MRDQTAERLEEAVREVCPIEGVSISRTTVPPTVRLDFRAEATLMQQQQAQALVAGWDWTPRRPRGRAALRQAIGNLTNQQQNQLLRELVVEWLLTNPQAAQKYLGIALEGDEPDVSSLVDSSEPHPHKPK